MHWSHATWADNLAVQHSPIGEEEGLVYPAKDGVIARGPVVSYTKSERLG